MDGMLSQDEINALLSGMSLDDDGSGASDESLLQQVQFLLRRLTNLFYQILKEMRLVRWPILVWVLVLQHFILL